MKQFDYQCQSNAAVVFFNLGRFWLNKFGLRYTCCIFFLHLFNSNTALSQKFSAELSGGLGSTLAKNEKPVKKSRAIILLAGYYNINKQLSVGVEVSTAGGFTNSIGGNASNDMFDQATNTLNIDPSNMNSNALLTKLKYTLTKREKGIKPFVEFGMGTNTFFRKIFDVPIVTEKRVKHTNFAFQPEIGFSVSGFQLSMKYLVGGKTPDYAGVNNMQTNVKLKSISISALYLSAGWRFDFGYKK